MQGEWVAHDFRQDGVLRSDSLRVQPFHLSKGRLGDSGWEKLIWLSVTQQVDSCLLAFKVSDEISAKNLIEDCL